MIILIFLATWLFSCKDIEELKTTSILEIRKESDGNTTFKGQLLLIQLYDNGEADADIVISKSEKETKFERKRFVISNSDLVEIGAIMKDLEKTEYKRHYLPNAPGSDVFSKTTIIFKSQSNQTTTIQIEENDVGVLLEKYEKTYPKPLVSMLKKVNEIRLNYGKN